MNKLGVCVLLAILINLSFAGCHFVNNGIYLMDVNTEDKTYIYSPTDSDWRELVCHVNREQNTFRTTQQLTKNSSWMRKYDEQGKLLEAKLVPIVLEVTCRSYGFSPADRRVVYFNDNSHWLHVFDLETQKDELLTPKISSSGYSVKKIYMTDENTVFVFLDDDDELGRKTGQILRIDIESGAIMVAAEGFRFSSHDFAFSPNREWGVFGTRKSPGLKVINFKTLKMKTIDVIGGNKIGTLAWRKSDVIMGSRVQDQDLVQLVDIKTGSARKICSFPEDTIEYYVFPVNKDMIIAGTQKRKDDSPYKDWTIIDINTGKVVSTFGAWNIGNIYQLNEKTLLVEF